MQWWPRYSNDYHTGTRALTLEERGAYSDILDAIYSRDGDVPDDDHFMCVWLGCDPRVWRRIRARLLALKKIRVEDGHLVNSRATTELGKALARVQVARKAGRTSAEKRKEIKERMATLNSISVGDNYNYKDNSSFFPTAARDFRRKKGIWE